MSLLLIAELHKKWQISENMVDRHPNTTLHLRSRLDRAASATESTTNTPLASNDLAVYRAIIHGSALPCSTTATSARATEDGEVGVLGGFLDGKSGDCEDKSEKSEHEGELDHFC